MSRELNKDNILPLEEPKSVQAQASAWLAKLDGNEPSPEDLRAFKQWVNEDTAHIAAFEKVAAAWDELNILTRLPSELQQRELRQQHQKQKIEQGKESITRYPFRYVALAATLVLALFIGLQQGFQPVEQASYQAAVGEQKTITLPDSSVVQLNTNSRIKFDYRGEVRAIYLYQGEAHFTVARNPQRPFEVYAGAGRVRAVGTAFSVMLNEMSNDIDVMVTEGVVEVAPEISVPSIDLATVNIKHKDKIAPSIVSKEPVKSRRVEAGSAVVFNQKAVQAIEHVEDAEMQRRLAWQQGLLIFSGEPLEDVVSQISRYTDTKIIIKSEEAKALRIGGQFQVADTKAIFSALEQGFGLKVDYATSSLVYLSYNKTPSQ